MCSCCSVDVSLDDPTSRASVRVESLAGVKDIRDNRNASALADRAVLASGQRVSYEATAAQWITTTALLLAHVVYLHIPVQLDASTRMVFPALLQVQLCNLSIQFIGLFPELVGLCSQLLDASLTNGLHLSSLWER